ncbi:FtsH protease activity modulator HflK [Bacteriovoracaceae bacterium]|nr:FtsH protease activity modulator HflK [Bacteriovoracaceae bacterium]
MNDWDKAKADLQKNGKTFFSIFIIVLVLIVGKTSFYTVEPDEEAIVIRFGKYIGTYPPGLHFKLPLNIDKAIRVKTKRVLQEEFGFRTASTRFRRTTYSTDGYEDESLILTGDLNVADVEWVIQYQISDPFKYLFQTSDPISNIRDVSESIMRRVVGDRLVTEVLTTGRVEISNDAEELMQDVLDKYDMGVKIVSVKLQDVNPPQVVKKSFNEVNEAKQEQEKMINQAEEAYNKVIFEASGKANKVLSQAEGFSQELINTAKGDASRFEQVLVEYRRAPRITKRRIYLETMQSLFTDIDDITIVDPKIKGLLPVFSREVVNGK